MEKGRGEGRDKRWRWGEERGEIRDGEGERRGER